MRRARGGARRGASLTGPQGARTGARRAGTICETMAKETAALGWLPLPGNSTQAMEKKKNGKGEFAWTLQEDVILFRQHRLSGPRWCDIATWLPGRSANSVRNRFARTTSPSIKPPGRASYRCGQCGFYPKSGHICVTRLQTVEMLQEQVEREKAIILEEERRGKQRKGATIKEVTEVAVGRGLEVVAIEALGDLHGGCGTRPDGC